MNKEQKLNMIFDNLAEELNITPTMLSKAETAYNALGQHIKSSNESWDVVVYPQGSFELGTVTKPLSDEEQYDVDLVVLVKTPQYNAETLRREVLSVLESHGRYEGKIENKKPCIRIQYADSSQFHMDIACAQEIGLPNDTSISIARFDGEEDFYFEISNPKGYIEWFKVVMQFEELQKSHRMQYIQHKTDVEKLTLSRARTPLQKAIQILKRHRDIFFSCRKDSDNRPSSIIITTLCAKAYEDTRGQYEKDNVYLTVVNMLEKFPYYINRDSKGEYYLENPSNPNENFLKKWNDNSELVNAFIQWVSKAREDIIVNPEAFIEDNPRELRHSLYKSFGEREVGCAFDRYGKQFGSFAREGSLKYDSNTSSIVLDDSKGKPYKKHTYYGGKL